MGDEHLTTELSMLNDFSVKNLLKYEKHKNKEEGGACVRPTTPRDNPRRLILFFFCVFFLSTGLWGGWKLKGRFHTRT